MSENIENLKVQLFESVLSGRSSEKEIAKIFSDLEVAAFIGDEADADCIELCADIVGGEYDQITKALLCCISCQEQRAELIIKGVANSIIPPNYAVRILSELFPAHNFSQKTKETIELSYLLNHEAVDGFRPSFDEFLACARAASIRS